MNYKFPLIKHIDDVWSLVRDCPAFIKAHRNEYTVINYAYSDVETFPNVTDLATAMRRECRGLVFDGYSGELISRPFHKFFNVNEKEETQEHLLEYVKEPHYILEKLDGSMVRPVKLASGIRWMTKMGITDTSMQAEVLVAKNPQYTKFAEYCIENGMTPIFEYVGPDNRIVLDYTKEDLILLAIRYNYYGTYISHHILPMWTRGFDIPIVHETKHPTKDEEGREGIVITYLNGHRVKLKTEWYVRLHKTKDLLSSERHLVRHILEDTLDDLIPLLPDKDKDYVQGYQHYFNEGFKLWRDKVNNGLSEHRQNCLFDRKTFAIRSDNVGRSDCIFLPSYERALMFRGWDSGTIEYGEFKKCLLGFLNRDKEFEKFKQERKHDLFLYLGAATDCNSFDGPTMLRQKYPS